MASFTDKVVIVTGASSGIGAGTALEYAKHGAKLVLGGRNEVNLQKTAKACERQGVPAWNICLVTGDLTKEADCKSIIDKALQQFGRIDILINNAGSVINGTIEKCPVADMDRMYEANVRSVYMLTRLAIPHLEKTKGSIINVSSIAGIRPLAYVTTYCIAKAAVCQLTQTIAQDVAARGIRVNCIAPGVIVTDIFTRPGGHMAHAPDKMEEFYKNMAEIHPLRRVGHVTEVAQAILYLTSEAAGFITGAILPIDGGRHLTTSVYQHKAKL